MTDGDPHDDPLAEERKAWDSVARSWRKWWRTFESSAQVLSDRLVAVAGVEPSSRVLDVGTGIGEPALTAARTGADVVGTDLSPEMIALARERASDAGIAVEYLVTPGEEIPESLGEFDAGTSRWGLMLMVDPVAAASRVRERLTPGGRFAAAVWAEPEHVPFLSVPATAARRELGLPAPDPDAPGPFRLQRPDELASVLERAGFADVAVEELDVTFEFAEPAEHASFAQELSSRLRALRAELDEATRARLHEALCRAAEEYLAPDGVVRFRNRTRIVSGRR